MQALVLLILVTFAVMGVALYTLACLIVGLACTVALWAMNGIVRFKERADDAFDHAWSLIADRVRRFAR